jgi:hypothetical protein
MEAIFPRYLNLVIEKERKLHKRGKIFEHFINKGLRLFKQILNLYIMMEVLSKILTVELYI